MTERRYPVIPPTETRPSRPISFVVVRFCDDYLHNALQSPCLHHGLNQLITVDNTANLSFFNLSSAINAGIVDAHNEIIAIVHEDVVLPEGWQACFEDSLSELERSDPSWGVLGAVGWTADGEVVGHYSDPHTYCNTFAGARFAAVPRLDEQILIIRRSSKLCFDENLPSIHNLGRDLPLTAASRGLRTYVVDAPTIHKYADERGRLIVRKEDSPKINERTSYAYRAEQELSDGYLVQKWPGVIISRYKPDQASNTSHSKHVQEALDSPTILFSRGDEGSRLLSALAQDAGLFLGNATNNLGESVELMLAVYKAVIAKHRCRADGQREAIIAELRRAAAQMLEQSSAPTSWGFNVQENMLVIPELARAFPRARFVHLNCDPLRTSLGPVCQSAKLDNQIGRVALPVAYEFCGLEPSQIFLDPSPLHMSYTTIHQTTEVLDHAGGLPAKRYLEIRFEELIKEAARTRTSFCDWLGTKTTGHTLEGSIDCCRLATPRTPLSPEIEREVACILKPLRDRLGYGGCRPAV
ncbi:MAG: sulfotransferase [Bdellovibrionota bacterium]